MDYGVMELYINEGQKVSKQFEKLTDYELDNFINFLEYQKIKYQLRKNIEKWTKF